MARFDVRPQSQGAQTASGPRANPNDFGAQVGGAVAQLGQVGTQETVHLINADLRRRSREDAVERARAFAGYAEEGTAELRRLQTEADLSSQEVIQEYGKFLKEREADLIANHQGSDESKSALTERLLSVRAELAGTAASLASNAKTELVNNTLGRRLNTLATQATDSPGSISELFAQLDADIDDMAPALTPDQEIAFRDSGREQIAIGAVESFLNRGDFVEAREILDSTPGLVSAITPEKRRQIERQISAFENQEVQARAQLTSEMNALEDFLKRPLTPEEKLRKAGLAPTDKTKTLQDEVDELRSVFPNLSDAEVQQAALTARGVDLSKDVATAQTDAGKQIQDREMFASQYGEDSPQVRAFDELSATATEPPKLTDIAGMRKEFTNLSKEFVTVRDSFSRISVARKDPSPAGDLALIFNYMKMLDPGSTVREGEFANAQNATNISGKIRNMYNQLVRGERLGEDQRTDFLDRSEQLFGAQLRSQIKLEEQFKTLASSAGFKPEDVAVDFVNEFRDGASVKQATKAPPAEQQQEAPSPPRFKFDLEGNLIGGGS